MIAVVIEDGIAQDVVTDDPGMVGKDILIVDYDTEGADEDETVSVPQPGGYTAQAYAYTETVGMSAIDLKAVEQQIMGGE